MLEKLLSTGIKSLSKLSELSDNFSDKFEAFFDTLDQEPQQGYEIIDNLHEQNVLSDDEALEWYDKFLSDPNKMVSELRNEGVNVLPIDLNEPWEWDYLYNKLIILLGKFDDMENENKEDDNTDLIYQKSIECIEGLVNLGLSIPDANYFKSIAELHNIHNDMMLEDVRRLLISALGSNFKSDAQNRLEYYERIFREYVFLYNSSPQKFIQEHRSEFEKIDDSTLATKTAGSGLKTEDFASRQFVYMVRNLQDAAGFYDEHNIRWIFKTTEYPYDMIFPAGHPRANTLYVAHPAKDMYYIPCENSEKILFDEKIRELMSVLTDLGATEISYRFIKGEESSLSLNKEWSAQVGVDVKVHKVSGGANNSSTTNVTHSLKTSEWQTRILNPTKKPFVAEDRAWLKVCPEWESFIHDRLSAGMLESSWCYTSSEVSGLTEERRLEINASYENLMVAVKGDGSVHTHEVFNTSNEYEIEITAKFKPLEEFEDAASSKPSKVSIPQFTKEEETFRDEVLFCLEDDGALSDTDRKYLERKRVKLGISIEIANEIIEQCVPSLTAEEEEYIETFKELVGEDEITPRLRRMLDREAETLGIKKERQQEIENCINK